MTSAPSVSLRLSPIRPIGKCRPLSWDPCVRRPPGAASSQVIGGRGLPCCCEAALRSFVWFWRRKLCHWSESLVSSGPVYVIPFPQIYLASEVVYSHRLQETPLFLTPVLYPPPSTPVLMFFSFPVCSLDAIVPKAQSKSQQPLPAQPPLAQWVD